MSDLVKREKLYESVDRERDTLVIDLKKVKRRVREIISSLKGDVIFEGHFATDAVPSNDVTLVFVLRRDPEDLKRILESRHYSKRKIAENVASEILDVCLFDAVKRFGAKKVHEIDVSSRDAEDVVREMIDVLEGKRERKIGIVDWLGKLEKEGKLEEYLKDI